jgi:hypothetical protein
LVEPVVEEAVDAGVGEAEVVGAVGEAIEMPKKTQNLAWRSPSLYKRSQNHHL